MEKKIITIPATLNRFNSEPMISAVVRRVAGYARVSTDLEEQASSYETQMSYYKSYIESRPDWEFVGMYSDEGVTATNIKHREGFKQMVDDALQGEIDLIITKSISRFARNTVDSLVTVRKLKENGIEIYFEKENIWTFDAKGELLITIMSSLAQEESRSISENTTWGKRKRFADGKGSVGYSTFLGYDKDFKINPEQAQTVKLIYKLFISGYSTSAIKKELEKRKIKAPAGGDCWHISTISSILRNEKYRGDALLQKQYTTDFLLKTRKKNNGEIPQYYVEKHHEAIIPPQQFDFVQAELARRDKIKKYCGKSIFSSKIQCGCCGGRYGSKVWHSNKPQRKVVFQCNNKYAKNKEICTSPHFSVEQIKNIFLKALNSLIAVKEETISNLNNLAETVYKTDGLIIEKNNLMQEINSIVEEHTNLLQQNARSTQDQEYYSKKDAALREQFSQKQSKYEEITALIQQKNHLKEMIVNSINNLQPLNEKQTKFNDELFGGLVDRIVATSKTDIKVIFRGGIEVKVK